jgi:hypothetical protein
LNNKNVLLSACLFLSACAAPPPETAKEAPASVPEIRAELVASDPSWGSAEGPALDSKNNLYFTSRGTWKGIVRWNKAEGSQRYAEVAKKAGPGGLWIDDADNIFLTATDEREVWKLSPAKKVTVVAKKGFEADPKLAKGPNDVVVAKSGIVYFTDPNGYYGDAPNGTVYWIDRAGKTKVFSAAITGPNGIILGLDEKTRRSPVGHSTKTAALVKCASSRPYRTASPMEWRLTPRVLSGWSATASAQPTA